MKSNIYIFSIGHSSVPLSAFLAKLKEHQVQVLVDCRSTPISRFASHFNKKPLNSALARETIKYLWRGQNIGGKRANVFYEETIDELVEMAKQGARVCVMCTEKDYKNCHRHTVLTPSFEQRGILVIHIEYEKRDSGNK